MSNLDAETIRNWVGRMRSVRDIDDKIRLERDMLTVAANLDKRDEPKREPAPEHRKITPGTVAVDGRLIPVQVRRRFAAACG